MPISPELYLVPDSKDASPVEASVVIGVDESGPPRKAEPFTIAAVCCQRTHSTMLTEKMIESGLMPWKFKNRGMLERYSEEGFERRVEQFIQTIEDLPIN